MIALREDFAKEKDRIAGQLKEKQEIIDNLTVQNTMLSISVQQNNVVNESIIRQQK